jgi:hypothetical protein
MNRPGMFEFVLPGAGVLSPMSRSGDGEDLGGQGRRDGSLNPRLPANDGQRGQTDEDEP